MNKKNSQKNLNCLLTAKVARGKRLFKIVDGTCHPIRDAHVFYQGYIKNLGETMSAFVVMGKTIEAFYRNWYRKNRHLVINFYKNK